MDLGMTFSCINVMMKDIHGRAIVDMNSDAGRVYKKIEPLWSINSNLYEKVQDSVEKSVDNMLKGNRGDMNQNSCAIDSFVDLMTMVCMPKMPTM